MRRLKDIPTHQANLLAELSLVADECNAANWDGYGATPVAKQTYAHARSFLDALPIGTPVPTVGAEPDGHLTFEWYQSPRRLLSVSVSPEGELQICGSDRSCQGVWNGAVRQRSSSSDSRSYSTGHSVMTEEPTVAAVLDEEWLARFVLFRKWIRSDQTVRPDALIPYPHANLSVTRHFGLMNSELWDLGQDVADARPATLYGRADLQAVNFRKQSLYHISHTNAPNHADVSGWPPDKPSQKIVAQEIAALATFVRRPQLIERSPGYVQLRIIKRRKGRN